MNVFAAMHSAFLVHLNSCESSYGFGDGAGCRSAVDGVSFGIVDNRGVEPACCARLKISASNSSRGCHFSAVTPIFNRCGPRSDGGLTSSVADAGCTAESIFGAAFFVLEPRVLRALAFAGGATNEAGGDVDAGALAAAMAPLALAVASGEFSLPSGDSSAFGGGEISATHSATCLNA